MNWKEFRAWKLKQKITFEEVAKLLGVTNAAVKKWRERDYVPPWIVAHIETIEGKSGQ